MHYILTGAVNLHIIILIIQ